MQTPNRVQPLSACTCGAPAAGPEYRAGRRKWVAACSRTDCPAVVVRRSKAAAADAWNDIATCINPWPDLHSTVTSGKVLHIET